MRKLTAIGKDLLFPKRCIFCGDIAEYPDYICKSCTEDYPFKNDDSLCPRCGKKKDFCICADLNPKIVKMLSACPYEGAAITCIKQFKGDKESPLGDNFALLLKNVLENDSDAGFFPYITYVPMEKEKIEKRGHNMAETLASKLASLTGRVLIAPPVEKVYTAHFQHDLKAKDRFKNAALTFIDKEEKVEGDIILVDDIITTGATIERNAEILIKNGAKRVLALSIAATQKRER